LTHKEFVLPKKRLEDMEDLLQLRKAKKAEGRKRTVSLARVKRQLNARDLWVVRRKESRGFSCLWMATRRAED
jgi:hypothetical protein